MITTLADDDRRQGGLDVFPVVRFGYLFVVNDSHFAVRAVAADLFLASK
jgi:hypothetical protein